MNSFSAALRVVQYEEDRQSCNLLCLQVWRTPEQIPPLYKLWKQLRRAIDQLKEVGVSAFSDDQAIEHVRE
jgi:hypothetical protein